MDSKKEAIFQQMKTLWEQFAVEHGKTTKVSQKNARGIINELKKLVTEYRAASVEESK